MLIYYTDIDECQTGAHVCADICINTLGSYMCECSNLGFKLSWDLASCFGKTIHCCFDVNEVKWTIIDL